MKYSCIGDRGDEEGTDMHGMQLPTQKKKKKLRTVCLYLIAQRSNFTIHKG